MKKLIEMIQKKWLKDTTKTVTLIVILFAIFISINIFIQKLDISDIDVTRKSTIYTIRSVQKTSTRYTQRSDHSFCWI